MNVDPGLDKFRSNPCPVSEKVETTDSLEKTLMLGKVGGRRRRGQKRMRSLEGIANLIDMSLGELWWWWTGKPGMLHSLGSQSQT